MSKILRIIKLLIDGLINLGVLVGLAIVLLWLFWGVSPQTSITKTAYFFSESWRLILGRQKNEDEFQQVGKTQVQDAQKHIHQISGP